MDTNKLKKLQEVGFKILPVCGLCHYAVFPANQWGTCGLHRYEHEKHTDRLRDMSVHYAGTCASFKPANNAARLETYEQFFVEKKK